jgi:poly-gamma-glutamate synthesis protein (capsule biosynthesis protein)
MKPKTRTILLVLGIFILTVILFIFSWLIIKNKYIKQTQIKKSISVYIPADIKNSSIYYDAISRELERSGYQVNKSDSDRAEVSVALQPTNGYVGLRSESVGAPRSLNDGNIVGAVDSTNIYIKLPTDLSNKLEAIRSNLASSLSTPTSWTMKIAGDIIIGRTVYEQEMRRNDYTSSFTKVKDLLQDADYTVADAEWTAADGIPHPLQGLNFSSPARSLDGLTYAGIDAVSLANNHSMNGGTLAFEQMLDNLTARGIGYFGAGRNYEQAHTPYVANIKGVKLAFLGYTSIPGNVESGAGRTGNAFIKIAPWYPFDEASIAQMEADVKLAKTKADVVVPYFHWSAEYTHQPNEQMRQVAHRAIDAGATMVVGSHPHWVQGIEWYKNNLIAYSLGNFVFDQEQSLKTKQGAVLSTTFEGDKLVKADLIPIQIEEYYQPHLLEGASAQGVLNDIFNSSYWKN